MDNAFITQLNKSVQNLRQQIVKVKDNDERSRLMEQYTILSNKLNMLIDKNVEQNTAQIEAAINKVSEASRKLDEAVKDLQKVEKIIAAAAKLASLIEDLLKKLP